MKLSARLGTPGLAGQPMLGDVFSCSPVANMRFDVFFCYSLGGALDPIVQYTIAVFAFFLVVQLIQLFSTTAVSAHVLNSLGGAHKKKADDLK